MLVYSAHLGCKSWQILLDTTVQKCTIPLIYADLPLVNIGECYAYLPLVNIGVCGTPRVNVGVC